MTSKGPCEPWSKHEPQLNWAHNYCRNPKESKRKRPWCYVGKNEWEYCDMPAVSVTKCTLSLRYLGKNFLQKHNIFNFWLDKRGCRNAAEKSCCSCTLVRWRWRLAEKSLRSRVTKRRSICLTEIDVEIFFIIRFRCFQLSALCEQAM